MQSYTVASAAELEAAVAAASARNCTQACTTITLTADITISKTLRLSKPVVLTGACAGKLCAIDGGGARAEVHGGGMCGARGTSSCTAAVPLSRPAHSLAQPCPPQWPCHFFCLGMNAGQLQIMKVEGYYAMADVRNVEFKDGRQDQSTVGIFGGAGEGTRLRKKPTGDW